MYLVGIDGSDCSNRAVEKAVGLAKCTGAKVKILYVMHWPPIAPITAGGVEPFVFNRDDEEKRIAKHIVEPLMKHYRECKVALSSEIVFGDPVETLCEVIVNDNVDLMFVGRKGRSTLVDLILGSVANKLAHMVKVPIMLVP